MSTLWDFLQEITSSSCNFSLTVPQMVRHLEPPVRRGRRDPPRPFMAHVAEGTAAWFSVKSHRGTNLSNFSKENLQKRLHDSTVFQLMIKVFHFKTATAPQRSVTGFEISGAGACQYPCARPCNSFTAIGKKCSRNSTFIPKRSPLYAGSSNLSLQN